MKTLKTFATSMRAYSLLDALNKAGIGAVATQPKWTNKKLPPPRIEVQVAETDLDAAIVVLADFMELSK